MNDFNWHPFDYDPVTMKSTYVRFTETGQVQFRETIPEWLARRIIDENQERAKHFDANGGWAGAKQGAVIANIPHFLDKHFKAMSGQDITKSGAYDEDKYNSFLDDSDYRYLRTGGGKIGKRKAPGNGIKSRLMAGITPLSMVAK